MNSPLSLAIPDSIISAINKLELDLPRRSYNNEIGELLERTVLMGGKRFRPLLLFIMGRFWGLTPEDLSPFAEAIEKVHAASLAHDDVIDQASIRRGTPSINVAGSNKKAILSGDYLLAQVIADMCDLESWEILKELSYVIQDLSLGEWLQIEFAKKKNEITYEEIALVAEKKTSSVITWCCIVPPLLAKAKSEEVEICRAFGKKLGLAFQFIDDTIDFSQTSNKDLYQDLKNEVMGLVSYELLQHPELEMAIEKVRARAQNLIASCLEDLERLSDNRQKEGNGLHEEGLNSLRMLLHLLLNRES